MADTAQQHAAVSAGRTRTTRGYEGGAGPHFQAMLRRIDERARLEAERGIRCWLLAPTIGLYQALMRGETVPVDQLNGEAVRRYGLRRTA